MAIQPHFVRCLEQCFETLSAPEYFLTDYFVLSGLPVPLSRKGS